MLKTGMSVFGSSPFLSHAWHVFASMAATSSTCRAQKPPGIQAVYEQALQWGAAHPDISDCWLESSNQTFEACCVQWSRNETPGQDCWDAGQRTKRYEHCCVPKLDWAPRSFFSCTGKGAYWERLRQTLALFRDFKELSSTPLVNADPQKCLIGGVLGHMLALVHVSHYKHGRTQAQKDRDYDAAEYLLKALLQSPVSLEELLVTGWPLFLSLDLFRLDPGFQRMAQRRVPIPVRLSEESRRWSHELGQAIDAGSGKRIPLDALMKFLDSIKADESLKGIMPLFTALVNYHNLRMIDQLRADEHDIRSMGLEAKHLIMFADTQLKAWLAKFEYPFSLFIQLQLPLVSLLQALSWPAVVLTRPGDYLRNTVHFAGSQVKRVLQGEIVRGMPLLEQHVYPGFDAASNMVRATEAPMCYADSFLLLVAAIASAGLLAGHSSLRVWDIGASYGDCLLWAASLLYASCSPAMTTLCLELKGFEPLPVAAAAFQRSARSFLRMIKGRDDAFRNVQVLVEQVAMRETRSSLQISFPGYSLALGTFLNCETQYGIPSGDSACARRETRSDTLDAYLARWMLENRGPIDLLKVHVQGDEVSVLRGANSSLAHGLVCAMILNLEHISLQARSISNLWLLLRGLFRSAGFVGVLVNLWDVRPATKEALMAAMTRKQAPWQRLEGHKPQRPVELRHELVLWRPGEPCSQSVAVVAAMRLWQSSAVGF